MWIKPEVSGFPMLPLQIVLRNDGVEKVPDRYNREGTHFVTLARDGWQQVVWEIEPLARDRVTTLEIGYWVNKMLANPTDRVAFEIVQNILPFAQEPRAVRHVTAVTLGGGLEINALNINRRNLATVFQLNDPVVRLVAAD